MFCWWNAPSAGTVQAGVVNDWVYGWYMKSYPAADLQQIADLVVDSQLDFDVGITLRNTDRDLLRVNEILDRLAANGVIAQIFAGYTIAYRRPGADSRKPFSCMERSATAPGARGRRHSVSV